MLWRTRKCWKFQNSTRFELCSRGLKSPYIIIQVHVQFLEHNSISVLSKTLSILFSNYCFNWGSSGGMLRTGVIKFHLVMAQTFDLYASLYEIWSKTLNRLEHSLKINWLRSYFEFILSSPWRNRISSIP
jgi:hypothetical protein